MKKIYLIYINCMFIIIKIIQKINKKNIKNKLISIFKENEDILTEIKRFKYSSNYTKSCCKSIIQKLIELKYEYNYIISYICEYKHNKITKKNDIIKM